MTWTGKFEDVGREKRFWTETFDEKPTPERLLTVVVASNVLMSSNVALIDHNTDVYSICVGPGGGRIVGRIEVNED